MSFNHVKEYLNIWLFKKNAYVTVKMRDQIYGGVEIQYIRISNTIIKFDDYLSTWNVTSMALKLHPNRICKKCREIYVDS